MQNLMLGFGLLVICYYDARYRRIPNILTLTLITFGIVFNLMTRGISGLSVTLLGLSVGMVLLIIPYITGGIGAGDVKLLGAIGAVLGAQFVVATFLYGAILGGIWSIALLIKKSGLKPSIEKFYWNLLAVMPYNTIKPIGLKTISTDKEFSVPYGIVISLGVLLVWFIGVPF